MAQIKTSEGFVHSSQNTRIYYRLSEPASAEIHGELLFLHGYGEHIGRYDEVFEAIAERGIKIIAPDFHGHGRSSGGRGLIKSIDDYLDDASAVHTVLTGGEERPVFVVGHSMGALMACHWYLRHKAAVRALVAVAPFFARALQVNPIKLGLGHALGRLAPNFRLPTGITGDMVSHDKVVADAYDHDPMIIKEVSAGWFVQINSAQAEIARRIEEVTAPLLMMHGDRDPIASFAATQRLYARARSTDKTLLAWPGMLHEILFEIERANVHDALLSWLLKH